MKGMPSAERKGVLDFELIVKNRGFFADCGVSSADLSDRSCLFNSSFGFGEPTSVLESVTTPSRLTSSSSFGGAGGETAGVGANGNPWQQDATSSGGGRAELGLPPVGSNLEIGVGGGSEKFAMDEWDSVLPESSDVSPRQDQSILRWIMGDVEDPALSKALQIGGGVLPATEFDFNGGFGFLDQGFAGGGDHLGGGFAPNLPVFPNATRSSNFKFSPGTSATISFHHQTAFDSSSESEAKPPAFTPGLLKSQHSQNPPMFFPVSYPHDQEQSMFVSPPPKRQNSGGQIPKGPFMDTGQQQQQPSSLPQQIHFLPRYLHQTPDEKPKLIGDATVDQIHNAAELVQTGNQALAHGILARLNHQLSPTGSPSQRAAFYCKEALLHCTTTDDINPSSTSSPPLSLIFKIAAFKSFSELSPIVQFANFTSNQAILEAFDGFDRIHIVDFDIGCGEQWASFLQGLALRTGGSPSVRITALISPSANDPLGLTLTRENLIHFASEISVSLDFQFMSIDSLSSASWLQNEGVAVNLPVDYLSDYRFSVPLFLRFVKELSPRIVVSIDRGCERADLSFANHVIHALHSCSNLLESLDAVNPPIDALQKIERFLIQPGIERVVTGRFRVPEKMQHWRAMFLSAGLSPVTFSNFAESQAECVVKRTPVGGFQVEKRQSSLVLCWQRKELVSVSAWRLC